MNETDTDRLVMKQLIFLVVAVLALLLVFGLLFSRAAVAQDREDRDRELRRAAERRYLKQSDASRLRRETGNYAVANGVVFDGDLVVTRGTVTIAGKVNGSVLIIRGDALIDSTGEILGDIVSVGGRIDRRPNSRVFGDMVETSPRYLVEEDDPENHAKRDERDREEKKRAPRWNPDRVRRRWQHEFDTSFDAKVRYNRVDGLYLGGELPRKRFHRGLDIDFFGFGGYALKGKTWQYQAGTDLSAGGAYRFAVGAELHDFTASQDEWIIPEEENSLAAALINEDFRDYYRRDGYSFFAAQHLGRWMKLTAEYRNENHLSLPNKTDWSLFANKKRFRANPAIDEGKLVSYWGQIKFDTRDSESHPRRGWFMTIEGETSRPDLNGEFDFDRVLVDLRRYQPMGYGKTIDLRLRAGTGRGELPQQYLFDLGGISTLRGYRFKEFTGDRMVMGNLEYRLNSGSSRLHGIPLVKEFNLVLFADAGLAWFADDNSAPDKSFDALNWRDLKTDVGVALTDRDGQVRLNFAKRTDVGHQDIVVTFRLNRDF